MFKQAKSALIWYYIYKFRRKLLLMVILLVGLFSADYIYRDIMEYLSVTKQEHLLKYALLAKWLIIFLCTGSMIYNLLSFTKKFNKKIPEVKTIKSKPSISPKEQRLYSKAKLRSQADLLIERKAQEKAKNS